MTVGVFSIETADVPGHFLNTQICSASVLALDNSSSRLAEHAKFPQATPVYVVPKSIAMMNLEVDKWRGGDSGFGGSSISDDDFTDLLCLFDFLPKTPSPHMFCGRRDARLVLLGSKVGVFIQVRKGVNMYYCSYGRPPSCGSNLHLRKSLRRYLFTFTTFTTYPHPPRPGTSRDICSCMSGLIPRFPPIHKTTPFSNRHFGHPKALQQNVVRL